MIEKVGKNALVTPSKKPSATLNFLAVVGGILIFCFLVAVAFIGKSLLVPLAVAVVLWYLINLLTRGFQSIPLGPVHIPRALAAILAISLILLTLWMIYGIIASNAARAIELLQALAPNPSAPSTDASQQLVPVGIMDDIRGIVAVLPAWMNIQVPSNAEFATLITGIFQDFQQVLGSVWATTRNAIGQVTATASTLTVILLYLVFMFMEQGTFEKKIKVLTGSKENYAAWHHAAQEVTQKLNAYVIIKTLMSLLTAVISLVVYIIFDVPFALFWALTVFVLNFIPVIGSIIAWILPMVIVLFGDYSLVQALGIGALLLGAQQLVGSIIEPRVAGDALNLSPLVILLSLAFWGGLWGVMGLFLAVPLTVVITVILSQFTGTHWIAVLLSRDGQTVPSPAA